MSIIHQGSVRVDLIGGTLDIHPINLILEEVFTINVATSLCAVVKVSKGSRETLKIISKDYNQEYEYRMDELIADSIDLEYFKEMNFLIQLLLYFSPKVDQLRGLTIELSSGAPAGSGLGGSSAMGITFMQALSRQFDHPLKRDSILKIVMDIEARVLNCGPTGYQDYYPAIYGGVLGLEAKVGKIVVHQLYSENLKLFLEKNMTLVFSGKSRFSAINNWEVYKSFFDENLKVKEGLSEIAKLSSQAFVKIKEGKFSDLLGLIKKEGELRATLFSGIETEEMTSLKSDLLGISGEIGLKVCGAGGGGCFLIIHPGVGREDIVKKILKHKMVKLEFQIEPPQKGKSLYE